MAKSAIDEALGLYKSYVSKAPFRVLSDTLRKKTDATPVRQAIQSRMSVVDEARNARAPTLGQKFAQKAQTTIRDAFSLVQPSVRAVGSRVASTPVLPFSPLSTPKNLFTRPQGTYGALDPGSLYGAFSQAKTPQDRMNLTQELALDMATPVVGMAKAKAPITAAQKRLKNLLTYADDMKRMGYGVPGGRGSIPDVKTAQRIMANELPQYYNKQAIDEALVKEAGMSGASWLTKTFEPLKGLTPDLQEAITQHYRNQNVAKIDADELARTFKSALHPNLEWKLVQYSQDPTAATMKALGLSKDEIARGADLIAKSRQFNDEIYAKAKAVKIDLNYLKNHIYQIFKENPDKVDDILAAKGLGRKPGFAQRRSIPTFMEAQKLGLTPKFTTFGQLNAAAQEGLYRAIANDTLAKQLQKSGQLLPQSQAPANWEKITARWFPKATVRVGRTNTIQQDWYAPRQLAGVLNNYFGGQKMGFGDQLLQATADISGKAQNILLSGGVGPFNFFGIGQLVKEATAGRLRTPLKAFFRAFVPGASKAYQAENITLIREMAQNGIRIRPVETYQKMFRNVADNPRITDVLGEGWHKIMDEPTFGKFMNELQIGFFRDTKASLLKKGIPESKVTQIAAEATKKFYGLTENIGRAQSVNDVITDIFLAPKYREGMLNIFSSIAQSLKPGNWSKVEYEGVRRLSIGMALTYGMYNVAQIALTGKPMWENPPGREFELVIPTDKPDKFYSIPWMPGFTAVPRRIAGTVSGVVRGDPSETKRQLSGLFSVPLSKGLELWANKDYFGREIVGEDTPVQDLALWGAKSFLPSYGRAALDYATGKSSGGFAIAQALEIPLKNFTYSALKDKAYQFEQQRQKDAGVIKKQAQGLLDELRNAPKEQQALIVSRWKRAGILTPEMRDQLDALSEKAQQKNDPEIVGAVRIIKSNKGKAQYIRQTLSRVSKEEGARYVAQLRAAGALTPGLLKELNSQASR